jgi:hypothetical protein
VSAESSRRQRHAVLTAADLAYVREQFVPLAEVCARAGVDLEEVRRRIERRELPAPPYPGVEYVPENFLELPDADEFRRTFDGPDAAAELEAYLNGTYFVCVRDATVANIARKGKLVTEIRTLLAEPRPEDDGWCSRLRASVDELDGLERPFSPDYDRRRFGRPLTRDELIVGARRAYARLWAVA